MPTSLSKDLRKLLENTTAAARVLAEQACRAALENLAVHEKDYRAHMTIEQRLLRNRLRSRGRVLADKRDERSGIQDIRHLSELAAYEHWHRLLFTRFLTENHLLITDEVNGSVPLTLEECEELAPELGARDGLDLACRFASLTLPGVFRRDDPVLDLPIALNDQVELRKLLATLPTECFRADDALGWTYQFWQAQRKKEVNDSGKKIGADELSPVTQLFTDDYMVEFLLHNTIGAWWAGKIGTIKASTEDEARAQAALTARDGVPGILWTYLRFVQDETTKTWLPAAGTFDAWPKSANLIRLLDPCMGSGHFLVFAMPMLVRLRMEEENLTAQVSVVSVLKDNIHGLELDERCTQIAAFNVALTAWKLAGYQTLPLLHLACSGLAPSTGEAEWLALAGESDRLRRGMKRLYGLFKDAPVLGSLINPRALAGDLIEAEFHELQPLLEMALAQEAKDDTAHEMAVIAHGLAKAAEILASKFTLVSTNVPYLGREKQDEVLQNFADQYYGDSIRCLSTIFLSRSRGWCNDGSTIAVVTPQNWLFQARYVNLRKELLTKATWNLTARLGEHAFFSPAAAGAFAAMTILSPGPPPRMHHFTAYDVSAQRGEPPIHADAKAQMLRGERFAKTVSMCQQEQLDNPDHVIRFDVAAPSELLSRCGRAWQGMVTGDDNRYVVSFWEVSGITKIWRPLQQAPITTLPYTGRSDMVRWEGGNGDLHNASSAHNFPPAAVLGRKGIAIQRVSQISVTLYTGDVFDDSVAPFLPLREEDLSAIWAFCESSDFRPAVRSVNQSLKVVPGSINMVKFDLAHWQKVASEKFPHGLPKPFSSDPTQWLFNGHPKGSDQPLHVAVVRLLGYRWPRQTGSSFPECPMLGPDGLEDFADEDGIVCLPPLNREQPAVARLRQLLTAALGTFNEQALIAASGLKGSKSKTLEDWLRDEFFEQHAKLFQDRPFIWHIWDGRSDGFHALVNYHKLDHATLQKLTYSYLGNWIQQQADDAKADKPGSAERLGAARALQTELAKILEGAADPKTNTGYDIFVRWKPLKEQAQGWHPDLNDGVRQNIRPFLLAGDVGKRGAGLFRAVPLTLKDKDRGTEPNRPKKDYPWFWCEEEPGTDPAGGKDFVGNRWNDVHLTLAFKKEAK
jgi:hypothetical protein